LGYLIAALVAPAAGPLLYWFLHSPSRATRFVDGSVYLAVPALVAWQVIHVAWEEGSPVVLLVVGAGLLLPTLAERSSRFLERYTDNVSLFVVLSGLIVHALLEGAALAPNGETPLAFGLAVLLHRIPVGLVIWWLIYPRHGAGFAAIGVGSVVVATALGYLLGIEVLSAAHGETAELYQAFVSGMLIHVVFHQGRHDHAHGNHTHHHGAGR
jgi:zinc transporter ZupT